ncbi:hypothetical protein [Paludibacter sp.]|uniref:hypothetical protein n=1 Tax=Paludibacter sp. TaxID=1898105 RepID=UPI001352F28D|nr:hypothetical protein [Paludibacter sp.]MTK52072.1 hypothetical protein [Paludibacter sp.]
MNKTIVKILFAILLPIFINSCSEKDYGGADSSLIPNIDNYKNMFSINVVSDSNYVTFNLNAPDVYPIWSYNDGTSNVVSTINGLSQIVHPAGTYTVTAKVANKYGISSGSVTLTYTLTKDFIDKNLFKYLCGSTGSSTKQWVWNSTVDGHFGCGPDASNPTGWWSCGANGKAGVGMYDDIFTFGYAGSGLSGAYTYDPGVGGTIYVNAGCSFNPFNAFNPHNNNDYQATVALQNTTWAFKYEGKDLYLTFPANTLVGYVPNIETYNTPKFKILSLTDNKLSMACYNGSIAWKYEFTPKK